ncbi:MAG: hypothetical protein V4722_25900 [Bacteroidota bacterium]
MTNRTHILNELESIAPALINAPVMMPYQLPDGYFESFPADLLDELGIDENHALAPQLVMASKENLYEVPAGYFEGLADIILDKIYKPEEQNDVPAGYFDSLPGIVLNRIHGMEVQEELEELAPVLNTINKQPVNFVPKGYFESLDTTAPVANEEAKVVSIKKKSNWVKYAVAACIMGVIAFTAISIIGKNGGGGVDEISITEALAKVDDATIENYLTTDETLAEVNSIAYEAVKDGEIKEFLQEFSDEELKEYLKNEGEDVGNN